MKFRKKPIVVEAEQFLPDQPPLPKGVRFSGRNVFDEPMYSVTTINGFSVRVVPGDWIIQETDGIHYYPCKADVFEKTYERVEE